MCEIKRLERVAVRRVAREQHVFGSDVHVVEGELRLAGAAEAHLHVCPGDRDAFGLEVDDDRADALRALAVGEAAPDEAATRLVAAGDVVLVRVQAVAVAVGLQARAHVGDGGPGFGLADPDAEEAFTARGDREPPLLHRVVAEVLDRAGWAVERQLGEDRARDVDASELLEDDRGLDVAHPHPAVALVHRDAEQIGLADGVPRPLGELLALVPVARVRLEVALGHLARQRTERLLVLCLHERVGPEARHGCEASEQPSAPRAGPGPPGRPAR